MPCHPPTSGSLIAAHGVLDDLKGGGEGMEFSLLNTFDGSLGQAALMLALESPSSKLRIGWPFDAQPI